MGALQVPSVIQNDFQIAQKASGITSLSVYNSALLSCTYTPNISESTTDGNVKILDNTLTGFNPILASIIDTSGKTVSTYDLIPSFKCNPINNSQKIIQSNSFQGSVLVYVLLYDSNGIPTKVFTQSYPFSSSGQILGNSIVLPKISIPASSINNYNSVLGTSNVKLEIFTEPTVQISTSFGSDSGLPNQVSNWTSWTDFPTNIQIQNLGSGSITVSANNCPAGQSQDSTGKCVATQANQISSADVKFFFKPVYTGDTGITCGLGATQNNMCLVSASVPNIPLTSLNLVSTSSGSVHPLSSLSVQLILYPKDTSLNLDSSNIGYTGAILYQDTLNTKTINIPASLIPVTQQSVRLSDGSFAFGTANIDPAAIDSLIKSSGLVTGPTPVPVTLTIYATGSFKGHGSQGNFQGAVNSVSFQLKSLYLSNSQGGGNVLTNDPSNQNVCHDQNNNVISCMIPPASGQPTPTSLVCIINPFDASCGQTTISNNPTPTCNSSDPNTPCVPPANFNNPPNNPTVTNSSNSCSGSCSSTSTQSTNTTPSTTSNSNTGELLTTGTTPTTSASGTVNICSGTTTADLQACANAISPYITIQTLNQNIIPILVGVGILVLVIIFIIKRRKP